MKCIFCDRKMERKIISDREIYHCTCPNCGQYEITREAFDDLPNQTDAEYKKKKYLISGFLREMNELRLPLEVISESNITYLFTNSKIPLSSLKKLDKLLMHIYRNTKIIYGNVILNVEPGEPAIGYAKNSEELNNMIYALKKRGLINYAHTDSGNIIVRLSLKGIDRAEKFQGKITNSKQAFVAMWFNEDMRSVFNNYISKAISDTGYEPFIIDMKEHNDDICDNIIAEVRNSRFVIADFTGHRGGVYFEAGFAYGLGIPVIWTCHKDWFDSESTEEIEVKLNGQKQTIINPVMRKVHFDIEHYNFIVWEHGEELEKRLKNRILATIPSS
jgi:nucleoside 2-deoxyribosyltransferase